MDASSNATLARFLGAKPADSEVDVYGLTHRGLVRRENQDHFLICSLHKALEVHHTSLPEIEGLDGDAERLAFFAMVADGVGGGPGGEIASRRALEAFTKYAKQSTHCYYTADPSNEEEFSAALTEAAMSAHAELLAARESDPALRGMATTMTIYLGVWPRAYLLQVGDSRYYLLKDGELLQVTRDQTLAQSLVDDGVFTPDQAVNTPLADVLSSSIGGSATHPVVTPVDNFWGQVSLLCTDGLTKHVSDDQIADRLRNMTSARQVCEDLVQDALDGGGTDNITVIVGKVFEK
jgi:PPM family protein phosphatase